MTEDRIPYSPEEARKLIDFHRRYSTPLLPTYAYIRIGKHQGQRVYTLMTLSAEDSFIEGQRFPSEIAAEHEGNKRGVEWVDSYLLEDLVSARRQAQEGDAE